MKTHSPRASQILAWTLLGVLSFAGEAHAQVLPGARRVAVVVGSNAAPPGRRALRYAREDARSVGAVLVEVGGFARADVDVLVEPSANTVIATLRRRMQELADVPGETLLVFHYAGHADAQGLFPAGELLPYEALRDALAGPGATVRVGIVDACRGGGWTGTRGLSEAPPFEVSMPMDLANEGTVLVASSSGLEDAHESESIEGGFFTHHWVAGLRGAGDQSGDGIVSLTEAFEYAKRLTVRDSAATGAEPQHPSFRMNLSGRADVPLTRVAAADASLVIEQTEGPTQLIHLDAGLLVLELPAGPRTARLAIMPGRYLVRVRHARRTLVTEILLQPDGTVVVREGDLAEVDSESAIARGDVPRVSTPVTPPGIWDLRIAFGVTHAERRYYDADGELLPAELQASLALDLSFSHGIGERGFWQFPLIFGARLGVPGRTAYVPYGGLNYANFNRFETAERRHVFSTAAEIGLRTETPLGVGTTLLTLARLEGGYTRMDPDASARYDYLRLHASLGVGFRYAIGRVEIGAAVVVSESVFLAGSNVRAYRPSLQFGSMPLSGREMPVVRLHLSRVFSLDAHLYFDRSLETRNWSQTFLLGVNATWPGAIARRRARGVFDKD